MTGKSACTPVIVVLPAEIDIGNSTATGMRLLDALDNPGLIIADMTGTEFCDSSGIRILLAAHDRASASGCELRIAVRPGSAVTRTMAILGVDRVLPIYASVEDATAVQSCARQPTA